MRDKNIDMQTLFNALSEKNKDIVLLVAESLDTALDNKIEDGMETKDVEWSNFLAKLLLSEIDDSENTSVFSVYQQGLKDSIWILRKLGILK